MSNVKALDKYVDITEHGIELMNNGTTLLLDENDIHIIENSATSSIDGQSKEERLGNDWGAIEISDRKRQIIYFFIENEKLTSLQLAEHTGLTQGRVRKILKELVADGMIEKVGDYRYASYTLKEKN